MSSDLGTFAAKNALEPYAIHVLKFLLRANDAKTDEEFYEAIQNVERVLANWKRDYASG